MSLLDTLNEKKLNTNYIIESKSVVLDKILSGSVVFFTGAGFSKSWSQDYPLGFDLFSINNQEQRNIFEVANSLNIKKPEKSKIKDEVDNEYTKLSNSINYLSSGLNITYQKQIDKINGEIYLHKKLKTIIKEDAEKK